MIATRKTVFYLTRTRIKCVARQRLSKDLARTFWIWELCHCSRRVRCDSPGSNTLHNVSLSLVSKEPRFHNLTSMRGHNNATTNMTTDDVTDHHDADGDDDEGADGGHYSIFFDNNSTLVFNLLTSLSLFLGS